MGSGEPRHAFPELYSRGQRVIGLGMEAASPGGASRLVRRAGTRAAWCALSLEQERAR
ncbi:MAG TPA: hypothetical protein VF002_07740 [Gaiellaceae bacterium]